MLLCRTLHIIGNCTPADSQLFHALPVSLSGCFHAQQGFRTPRAPPALPSATVQLILTQAGTAGTRICQRPLCAEQRWLCVIKQSSAQAMQQAVHQMQTGPTALLFAPLQGCPSA